MRLNAQKLMRYLEELAPKRLALDWDNVGLQVGSPKAEVNKILVALDVNEDVLAEAAGAGADFIITHHPLFFHPLTAVRTDLRPGTLIAEALAKGIGIYAAHTNLDLAGGGVNDALAKRLELTDVKILQSRGHQALEKITVFVPADFADAVRDALSSAGAGWIGNYSHCTFQTAGTGTFIPREGANPYLGTAGKLERVDEVRLETIVPAHLREQAVRAMLKAHPYEEAAYDLYALANEGEAYGLGRVGKTAKTMTLEEFSSHVKEKLSLRVLRVAGDPRLAVNKVAVCGGNGGDLIQAAVYAGADVLVTGDVKYHQAGDALAMGLAVADAGHDATETVVIPALCSYLQQKLPADGYHQVEVIASKIDLNPWKYY